MKRRFGDYRFYRESSKGHKWLMYETLLDIKIGELDWDGAGYIFTNSYTIEGIYIDEMATILDFAGQLKEPK